MNELDMMSPEDIALAKERGRLKAYEVLLLNPRKREAMEKKWGLERMKRRWPELYAVAPPPSGILWQLFLDRTFGANSGVASA